MKRRTRAEGQALYAQVVKMRQRGMSYVEIATALNITRSWVSKIAAHHGCAAWGLPPLPVRNMVVLYTEEGWTLRQLADKLGTSAGRVSRTLVAYGVKLRKRSPGKTPTAKIALYARRGLSWRQVAHACGRFGKNDPESLRKQYLRAVEKGEINP